jgi:hypothetical protein
MGEKDELDLQEERWEGVDGLYLPKDREKCRTFVNAAMSNRVFVEFDDFL